MPVRWKSRSCFQNATIFGGARYIDFDGFNLLNLEAGLGFHLPISNIVDFTGGAALELDKASRVGSDLGFGLSAGVRARPFGPQWELDGGLKYVDVGHYDDGDHTRVAIGARLQLPAPRVRGDWRWKAATSITGRCRCAGSSEPALIAGGRAVPCAALPTGL